MKMFRNLAILSVLLAFVLSGVVLAKPASSGKLTNSDDIMRGFAEGGGTVKVIVNLSEPSERETTNWKSDKSLKILREKVAKSQETVLASVSKSEFRLRHRLENQTSFSGEVTLGGLEKLQKNPHVTSIEPIYVLEPHLRQGIPLMYANVYRSTYYGQGTAVAICDTGVDYRHPMLGNGGFPNSKVIGGYDLGDNDADPLPHSTQAHGTACAGIAAGDLGDTGDYIGGAAPGAKLYALKITAGSSSSTYDDTIIAAWDWCVTHKNDDPANPIVAISTSFGGGRSTSNCDGSEPAYVTAVNNATAAGITLTVSAGNDGYCDSLSSPACLSGVISTGAVYDAAFGTYQPCISSASCATKYPDASCSTGYYASDNTAADLVTSYSNTASFLTLLSPSNQSYTTDIIGPDGYASGDYTSTFGGTSAASPYTAGAIACLQSAAKASTGNFLAPADVKSTLTSTGNNITDTKVAITKPRVNLAAAIDSVVSSLPPISAWLPGSIHYHTTNSDGSETVQTMVTTYRDTGGQSFSCISDHDYISDASVYSTSTFVGVNGVEADLAPHCVGFGVSGSGSVNYGSTLQAEIDSVRAAGGIPMVAHTRWSQENQGYDMPTILANMTNCNIISVYNWYCQDLWGNGNSETYWDTLLTSGKVIYGYAEDDTHGLGRQGYTFNRVGVAPVDLSLANLKTAFSNGSFYFGHNVTKWGAGITVSSYTVSGTGLGGTINIATNGATTIQFIGSGGSVLQTTNASSAAYTIAGSEVYVRVKATNAGGDITWLQPVFVTGGGGGAPPIPASIDYPASSNSGVYLVSWASSSGATSYQLQRSDNGGASWSGDIYSGANTSYTESIGNGSYRYRVKATNANGSSDWRTGTTDCVVSVAPIEGYEPLATGGAGGTTVHITNLADSGTGSLRAAVAALTGSPTIIVFDVGGVICVSGEIRITKANVTIDGSTAPAPGITLAGAAGTMFGIDVDLDANVIIKHVRFRNAGLEDIQVWEGGKITIDHCSFSGSGDGALDINTGNHIVVSRCIFADCIEVHKAHGTYISVHHNLYSWNNRRQPRVFGAGPYWDFRNNIMEYWTNSGTNILVSDAVNVVNNWYGNPSPEAGCNSGFWSINDATNVYTSGNYSACGQNIDAFGNRGTPNLEPSVTTTDAATAHTSILGDVGAQPNDAIDQYYIAGGGTSPPGVGGCGGAGPILEWVGPNGTASPWETAANWYDLGTGAARVPTNADTARLYNALGLGFTDSNVTVSSTTAICLKLQMRYLITKLTILTGGKLTTTGSVEMYLGTSAQLDIQAGATMDACTRANTSTGTFKLANDNATTAPATVNLWGTLNIVSLNPPNGTSDLQICNVSGGTGTGTININSTGVLNTEAYTIGSYGTGRIYVTAGGTMKVTGNVTTQVNADITAGKIAGAGGATLSVNYNAGENKTYVTATGGGGSPPPVPASITYPTSSGTGQYTVSWASSTGATSYQLQRSSNGGGTWSGDIYSGANTSYAENIGNGSYRYRVKATNANGSSAYRTGTTDCVVFISQWSETADYYVDGTTGLDTNPGSSSQPWATITKAISVATAGKKVLIWGGQTYTGALTLSQSGTSASPITFKRDPASGTATINGNGTTSGAIYSTSRSYNVFDGFTLTNARYGFYNYGAANGLVIKNCRITGNTQHGVYIRSGDNHTLFNDAIYTNGSAYSGVYVYSSALNNDVIQCSIYQHKYGVHYSTSCTGGDVTNCIITNHTTNGVRCYSSSSATITYTDNWNNYVNYYGSSAGTGCISANPLYVSPGTGDFHLQAGSPADNTGSDGGDMGYRYSSSAL